MGWKEYLEQNCANYKNFVLLGEAGSGKSEIALNLAAHLAQCQPLPVHFFDLDMTKPLFRSRDLAEEMEALGVHFHFEKQFMDAPTQVGGVNRLRGIQNAVSLWMSVAMISARGRWAAMLRPSTAKRQRSIISSMLTVPGPAILNISMAPSVRFCK